MSQQNASMSGLRVVAVEHFIAGPFCTQLMADQGADVIKVESPGASHSGYFPTLNRNKRSIVLDLKSEQGIEALLALVETADVFVTNMAAGVPARLGFDHERLSQVNPRLVYVHITGFGQNSPYRSLPAFDGVIQAMSGVMDLTGEPDGAPMLSGVFIPDHLTGLWAALAVNNGLLRRQATGQGSYVDLSMLDCMMSFHGSGFMEVLQLGSKLSRIGSRVRGSYASTYRASDGYVYLAPLTGRMWQGVSRVIGKPELLLYMGEGTESDTRLEHRDTLDALIEGWTSEHTVAEVVEQMRAAGVAGSAVHTMDEVVADPHLEARNMLRTVPDESGDGIFYVPGSPVPAVDDSFSVAPPRVGQHTDEILAELGLTPAGAAGASARRDG
ncbi:CaiB/BaiF CoA transferase family protein [Geodermatophilus sp. URMC 62]|uniref:CaiB/BaiF CoA transferase family protein n=1 Tax=Geodermatophilus sp. URMC 62 TaxID=3423414 RepID=UPI00406D0E99